MRSRKASYDQALSSFKAAQTKAWLTLGRDASTVFATNLPSRDGLARVEIARGNRAAAIEEYRRLTAVGPANRSSAVLEPRHILELARLLEKEGDKAGARVEYERFLKLWANADAGLPELTEAKKAVAVVSASRRTVWRTTEICALLVLEDQHRIGDGRDGSRVAVRESAASRPAHFDAVHSTRDWQ